MMHAVDKICIPWSLFFLSQFRGREAAEQDQLPFNQHLKLSRRLLLPLPMSTLAALKHEPIHGSMSSQHPTLGYS